MISVKTYKGQITKEFIPTNGILVFGSNTQGRHGKGMALIARNSFGAKYGQAQGLQGCSYAIITKDLTKPTHPSITSHFIIKQIDALYEFAIERPEWDFYIPYNADNNNLNNYSGMEMAAMFYKKNIPSNIVFEESFGELLNKISSRPIE